MSHQFKAYFAILFLLLAGTAVESRADNAPVMSAAESLSITKHEEATFNDHSKELPIRLMVFADRGLVFVIPTCWGGVEHSDEESITYFKQSGVHLGGFRSRTLAHHYAEMLSELNDDDFSHLLYDF